MQLNTSCISHLLMKTLRLDCTIALLMVEVGCLQHPIIQAHAKKTLVINNAEHFSATLLHFLRKFTAANTLSEDWLVDMGSQLPH